MKIDALSSYPAYRGGGAPAKAAAARSDRTGKTDVVDFSRGQSAAPDKNLLAIKSGILHDVAMPTPAKDLAALKESIREGSYHRSTDEIVDAILGNQ